MIGEQRLSRRAFVAGGVRLVGAAGLVSLTGSLAGCRGGESGGTVPIHSDLVNSSYGVQIHASFQTSVYAQYDAVTALLQDLGVRCVRDKLSVASPAALDYLESLGELGITSHLTVPIEAGARADRAVAWLGAMGDRVDSLAGNNEPNASGDPAVWAPTAVEHQSWLWDLGRQLGVPVCSPPLKQHVPDLARDYAALGEAGAGEYCDVINIHNYPQGRSPSFGLDEEVQMAQRALGDKPVYCTEGGYFTAPAYDGSANPVTLTAQGVYAPRQLLESVIRGQRFWQYELLDDPDPAGSDIQSHFGLVQTGSLDPASWQPKPAFTATRELLRQTADPGPPFDPDPVDVEIDGPPDLRALVAGKRDGTTLAILWRDVDVFDPETGADIDVPATRATITVDGAARRPVDVAGEVVIEQVI